MTTNELIEINMGLIIKISNKFYNTNKEDLIQAGVIGLLKAYQNYKNTETAKFSTYAYPYIFGEMYSFVNSNRNIKINKDLLKIYKYVEKARYELAQKLNYIPSNEEIAIYLEQDINMVNDAILSAQAIMSIDDEANEMNLHEIIPDNKNNNIDLKIDLDDSFKVLNKEEQEIIRSRYYEDLTQREVARKLNMTQVMVSRYEKRSLEKMKQALTL